jgi:hypothetical protein
MGLLAHTRLPQATRTTVVVLTVVLGILGYHVAPAAAATRIHYDLCSDSEQVNEWQSNGIRNYRYAGSATDCGTNWGTQCESIIWAAITRVNNGEPNDQVGVYCGDINDWEHGNVVAISRCRFTNYIAGEPAAIAMGCNYLRY